MIPLRSRSDSFTFTPELSAIASGSNFSRCPVDARARFVELQATIEAIDRAIEDEEGGRHGDRRPDPARGRT